MCKKLYRLRLIKELPALRGLFGNFWSQNLKVAFHQFHSLLFSVKVWHLFNFYHCHSNKMAAKIGLILRNCHFGSNLRFKLGQIFI